MRVAACVLAAGVIVSGGCAQGQVRAGPSTTGAAATTVPAVSVEEAAICREAQAAHALLKRQGAVSTHDLDGFLRATTAGRGVTMRAPVADAAGSARERADAYLGLDLRVRMQGVDEVVAENKGVAPPVVPTPAEMEEAAWQTLVALARLVEVCG